MKTLTIISTGSIKEVHGANYVLNNLIKGSVLFKDIKLRAIYSSSEDFILTSGATLPIGDGMGTPSYNRIRRVRSFFREILSSRYALGAYIKEYLNFRIKAHKVAMKIKQNCINDDILLFQDVYSAYFYFKEVNFENVKTAMIIHQEDDSMSQLFLSFPYFSKPDKRQHFFKMRDFVYSKLDALIYISEKARLNSIALEDKRRMIYNGIPAIHREFISECGNRESINLVCVGSMSGRKGQELIIEALSMLPKNTLHKLKLFLVGDGGERQNLERLTLELGIADTVIFTGVRNDIEMLLINMDVFVMPSLSEGLSISSLEALRAGLFLLMTDTGGNCEVMGDDCGLVVKRSPADISKKIEHIINAGIITTEQKDRSRKRFEKYFSIETMASEYDKILSQL